MLRGCSEALELYAARLSSYELDEIHNYPQIWFLGLDADKVNAVTGAALNSGFDDQHGSYIKVCIRRLSLVFLPAYFSALTQVVGSYIKVCTPPSLARVFTCIL